MHLQVQLISTIGAAQSPYVRQMHLPPIRDTEPAPTLPPLPLRTSRHLLEPTHVPLHLTFQSCPCIFLSILAKCSFCAVLQPEKRYCIWRVSGRFLLVVLEKRLWVKYEGRFELTGQGQVASGCKSRCFASTLLSPCHILGLLRSAFPYYQVCFALLTLLSYAIGLTDGPPSGSQPGGQWVQAAASATLFLTMAQLYLWPWACSLCYSISAVQ